MSPFHKNMEIQGIIIKSIMNTVKSLLKAPPLIEAPPKDPAEWHAIEAPPIFFFHNVNLLVGPSFWGPYRPSLSFHF